VIPEQLLQMSVKIANEAPSSMKDNMKRAYSHFS